MHGKHVAPQRTHCTLERQCPLPQKVFRTPTKDIGTPEEKRKKKKKDGLVHTLMTCLERTIVENTSPNLGPSSGLLFFRKRR